MKSEALNAINAFCFAQSWRNWLILIYSNQIDFLNDKWIQDSFLQKVIDMDDGLQS